MERSTLRVLNVWSLTLLVAFAGACTGDGRVPMNAGGGGGGFAGSGGACAGGGCASGSGGASGPADGGGADGGSTTTGRAGNSGSGGAPGNRNDASADRSGAAGQGGPDGGPGGAAGGGGGSSNFPARFAAPYVETWNSISLTGLVTATGHKFYTLAFVLGNGCSAAWNGDTAISAETFYAGQITNLRRMGGDVIISFGGAAGTELGDVCTTVASLQAAYQSVITRYNLQWMDLDIESGAESRTANIDRRNKALASLQSANRGLKVSYTLAVSPTGLGQAQRALLANASANGVRVDTVNVMAMDYGACNLDMGQAAIGAASGTRAQLQALGTASSVGVTPMTGVNDVTCENFTTANATALVAYAQDNGFINLLAFWSVGRDSSHQYLNIFKTLH
jgi:chitinase